MDYPRVLIVLKGLVSRARKLFFRYSRRMVCSSLALSAGAFNVPLKCTPEEKKHFVDPALKEAEGSNFTGALEVVNDGLNAHPASEGLLFLRSYFCYKIADSISNEISAMPQPIQTLGDGSLMVDGASTSQMLGRFHEIVKVLGDAEEAINEILQVNPKNNEVMAFRAYIDSKLQKLGQESENMRLTFNNTPNIAGGFCVGCRKNISFDTQTVVFHRTATTQLEVWHLPCFKNMGKQN